MMNSGRKDGDEAIDWMGRSVIIFDAPWYRIDRWIWWMFLCDGLFSRYEWSLIDMNGTPMRSYLRKA